MSERRLLVRVDGELMADADARELWKRFSEHMENNRGDLSGFAAKEGMTSIRPSLENGMPLLVASHSEAQVPYANASAVAAEPPARGARERSSAGSPKNQPRAGHPAKKR